MRHLYFVFKYLFLNIIFFHDEKLSREKCTHLFVGFAADSICKAHHLQLLRGLENTAEKAMT